MPECGFFLKKVPPYLKHLLSVCLSAYFLGIFFFGQSDKIFSAVQRHQPVLRGRWRQKRSMAKMKPVRLEVKMERRNNKRQWRSGKRGGKDGWLEDEMHVKAFCSFNITLKRCFLRAKYTLIKLRVPFLFL